MYCKFYDLSQNPFDVTPDPRFLFFTDNHREALASMIYGITERKGFIAITGEVGTGKTTLVHHLLQTLDKATKTVFIYQTHISFEGFLRNILIELEIEPEGKGVAPLIRQLNDYLIQRLVVDENLAILIDEAQNLSKGVLEDLRMLSNLETPNFKLIQIVFLGQPEFDALLNSPDMRQLKQRIGIRRQLRALTDLETRQYIGHRMKVVGGSSSRIFSPGALALIARHAEGIPRKINMICDNALLIGYSLSSERIDEKIIREVLDDMGIGTANRPLQTSEENIYFEKTADHSPLLSDPEPTALDAGAGSLDSGGPGLVSGPSILRTKERIVISAARPQPWRQKPPRNRHLFPAVFFVCLALGVFFGKDYIYDAAYKRLVKSVSEQALMPAPAPFVKVSVKAKPGEAKPPAGPKIDATDAAVAAVPSPAPEPKAQPSEPAASLPVVIASAALPQSEKNLRKIIAVQPGDTIYSLSRKYLHFVNTTLVDMILEVNPKITNPHHIEVNQRVKIPEVSPRALVIQSPDGTRKILLGTFLTPEFAEDFRSAAVLKEKEIEVIPRKVSQEETWYRLVAGPFASGEEGLKAIEELQEKGLLPAFAKTSKPQGA